MAARAPHRRALPLPLPRRPTISPAPRRPQETWRSAAARGLTRAPPRPSCERRPFAAKDPEPHAQRQSKSIASAVADELSWPVGSPRSAV